MLQVRALFEHRKQQIRPVEVEAVGGPARYIEAGGRQQGLYLGQNRPHSLHDAGDAGARGVLRPSREQHL